MKLPYRLGKAARRGSGSHGRGRKGQRSRGAHSSLFRVTRLWRRAPKVGFSGTGRVLAIRAESLVRAGVHRLTPETLRELVPRSLRGRVCFKIFGRGSFETDGSDRVRVSRGIETT